MLIQFPSFVRVVLLFYYWLKVCKRFCSNFVFKTTFRFRLEVASGKDFKFVFCMDITYSINCNDGYDWRGLVQRVVQCSTALISVDPFRQLAKNVCNVLECIFWGHFPSRSSKPAGHWPKIKIRAVARPGQASHHRTEWSSSRAEGWNGAGQKLQLIADWFRQESARIHTCTNVGEASLFSALSPRVLTFMSNADFSTDGQCHTAHPLVLDRLPIWTQPGQQ